MRIFCKTTILVFTCFLIIFLNCTDNETVNRIPEYNKIDAVASASKEIKVDTGSVAFGNFAILNLFRKDSYSHHWLGYGINGFISDTLVVTFNPVKSNALCTLVNLKPATTYHYIFAGDIPTNAQIESHSVAGTFATVPLPPDVWDFLIK